MYLSRVQIDVNNRAKIKDLNHLGAYHNWVEQSFPEEVQNSERLRHLWRIDDLAGKKYLLVLSKGKPDLQDLERYGVKGTAVTKSYDRFLNDIHTDQIMRFRLVANPTHAVTKKGESKHRIFPHVTVEQQRQWLVKKANNNGFSVVDEQQTTDDQMALTFDVVSREYQPLRRSQSSSSGRGARLSKVAFEGILRVTDESKFKNALIHGIGREKAYGMGLMTVIPEA